jgi:hypothetical protein
MICWCKEQSSNQWVGLVHWVFTSSSQGEQTWQHLRQSLQRQSRRSGLVSLSYSHFYTLARAFFSLPGMRYL